MSGSSPRGLRISAILALVLVFLLPGTARSLEWTSSAWNDQEFTVSNFQAGTVPAAAVLDCDTNWPILQLLPRVIITFRVPENYGPNDVRWVLESGTETEFLTAGPTPTRVSEGTYRVTFESTLLENLLEDLLGTVIDLVLGLQFRIGSQMHHEHPSWSSTTQYAEVSIAPLGLSASCTPLN